MHPLPLNPASLSLGARVGSWRIVDWRGRGAHGAVFLVEGVAPKASGPAALKLALFPRDERFAREVELLARLHHPAVPRLLDHGRWKSPAGQPHPFLVMEWVEGLPLYEWARFRAASSRQVLQVLAALARALEATHALGAVHRDVKGGNVLVRPKDGQAFLIDFGSCRYPGADPLTEQVFPPGTPTYRSPEAFRFERDSAQAPARTYAPGPADDLFALGVSAYRLVTGQYPPMADPREEGFHVWAEGGPGPQPARALNARCDPELGALISRMLSLQPEARGSARELAEALEQAARRAGPEADEPLFLRKAARPVGVEAASLPVRVAAPAPRRDWRPCRVVASLAGPVAVAAAWALRTLPEEQAAEQQVTERVEEPDAGTVAVGDSALTAQVASPEPRSAWSAIGLDLPSKPLQGQTRPDTSGRCPSLLHVPINGGCWIKADVGPKGCPHDGYVYRGGCYTPAYPPPRPATSSPAQSPDGG